MEQEEILSTLSERLGQTSFSQKTLEKYIELNPVDEGTEPDEAYWDKAVTFLKGMQGQYNHDVATEVEDFKKNYKPQSETPAPESTSPSKKEEDWEMKFRELEERLNKKDEETIQSELLKKVTAGMKAKHASDTYVLSKTLQGVTFDIKKSVDDLVSEYLPKYDAEFKACRGNGTPPRTPSGSGGTQKNAASDFFARKGKKEGWGK